MAHVSVKVTKEPVFANSKAELEKMINSLDSFMKDAFMKMLNSNSNNNFEDLAVVAASAIAEKIADFNEMAEQTKG